MGMLARIVVAAALTAMGCGAHAAVLSVTNPGFEDDFAPDGSFPVLTPSGWTAYDPNGILDGQLDALGVVNPTGTTFFPAGVPEGRNAALVYLQGQPGEGEAGLSQTLGATLQANTRYTLSVAVGNIASGTGLDPYDQFGFFELSGFPGYRVELRAGDLLLEQDDNTLVIPDGSFATAIVQVAIGAAHPALGQPLSIRLLNLNLPGTPEAPGIEVDFDQVVLEALPVPEPSTYAFLALGLLLVGLRGRFARLRSSPR